MKKAPRTESELREAITSPSFTPGVRDIEPLITLLYDAKDEVASAALHALVRGGALAAPTVAVALGMDSDVLTTAFVVVVIGGLGSFAGSFIGALLVGLLQSFGILIFPAISIVLLFAIMAVVLIVRPWGLLGRPEP